MAKASGRVGDAEQALAVPAKPASGLGAPRCDPSRKTGHYPFPHGCGYSCPCRDTINGRCEVHGPTAADAVVERVTTAFKRDLAAILRSDK